jgi:hypothetical protein
MYGAQTIETFAPPGALPARSKPDALPGGDFKPETTA